MPKTYIGNGSNKAKKSKKIYIGNGYDLAKRCKKVYIGDSNNKARLAHCDILTPLVIHQEYNQQSYFVYNNERYNTHDREQTISNLYLKDEQETIRFFPTQWEYPQPNYYDIEIIGGQTNHVYVMPEGTYVWYGGKVPNTLSFSPETNNNGWIDTTTWDGMLAFNTNSIYNYDVVYIGITFYCNYSGTLWAKVSGMDVPGYQEVSIGNIGSETYQYFSNSTPFWISANVAKGNVRVRYKVQPSSAGTSNCHMLLYDLFVA